MFNFFKRGNRAESVNGEQNGTNLPEVPEHVFIEPGQQFTEKNAPPPEHNIGLLYAFLDRNHEVKGYDDALLNPDVSHLNQNLDALRNELIRTLNKVKTFYEDFIQETEFHITSRSRSGMVDMVEELEMKRKIALAHIDKVRIIEEAAARNEGDGNGTVISYTRGFKNGLAAISHHHILTKQF